MDPEPQPNPPPEPTNPVATLGWTMEGYWEDQLIEFNAPPLDDGEFDESEMSARREWIESDF